MAIHYICHVFYPTGKPRILHLLCCQGFAVCDYSFTLDAADLQHLRLLQRQGLVERLRERRYRTEMSENP